MLSRTKSNNFSKQQQNDDNARVPGFTSIKPIDIKNTDKIFSSSLFFSLISSTWRYSTCSSFSAREARRVARSFLASTSGGGGGGGGGATTAVADAESVQPKAVLITRRNRAKRRHWNRRSSRGIRSRVAVRSPSDVPDGSNRMEDIPEGVLYGER